LCPYRSREFIIVLRERFQARRLFFMSHSYCPHERKNVRMAQVGSGEDFLDDGLNEIPIEQIYAMGISRATYFR